MTIEIIVSSNNRVHDMCLGSHFMTRVTVIEQSKDFLLGDRQQIYEGGNDVGGSYIYY